MLLLGVMQRAHINSVHPRTFKVILSVGGGTFSGNGHFNFITDADKRAAFVQSALGFIEDYGLDGLDIDYEYPDTAAQGQGFADLLTSLRTALNSYASSKGDTNPYIITVRDGYSLSGVIILQRHRLRCPLRPMHNSI